jgi:hypothetical protein
VGGVKTVTSAIKPQIHDKSNAQGGLEDNIENENYYVQE